MIRRLILLNVAAMLTTCATTSSKTLGQSIQAFSGLYKFQSKKKNLSALAIRSGTMCIQDKKIVVWFYRNPDYRAPIWVYKVLEKTKPNVWRTRRLCSTKLTSCRPEQDFYWHFSFGEAGALIEGTIHNGKVIHRRVWQVEKQKDSNGGLCKRQRSG